MMIRNLLIIASCLFISCVWWDELTAGSDKELILKMLPQIPQNSAGYYILNLSNQLEQASHRVYAYLGTRDYQSFEYDDLNDTQLNWHSNLYTLDDDTSGYYRKRRFLDDEWTYINGDSMSTYNGDTSKFKPIMVPTSSISNDSGMVSTTINIPPIMFNDTLILEAATLDQFDNCPLDSCYVGIPILFR